MTHACAVDDLTAQLMDEALRWSARRVDDEGPGSSLAMREEAARLLGVHGRKTLEEAAWTLAHATDLTDGRAKAHAIAVLDAAIASAPPEGPADLA